MAPRLLQRRSVCALAAGLVALSGCSSGDPTRHETVHVYAAASLHQVFTTLSEQYERDHPGTRVLTTFAGSADLVEQVEQGAPADVVATADGHAMRRLEKDHLLVRAPVQFATNTLELAVPSANPARVTRLQDLERPGIRLVTCAPQVPCGAAARSVARASGVVLHPVSEEQSVTDVLGKVRTGEADAGLVYVTDVRSAAGSVVGIRLPHPAAGATQYNIAAVRGSRAATDFMALVTGAAGRRRLQEAGFGTP